MSVGTSDRPKLRRSSMIRIVLMVCAAFMRLASTFGQKQTFAAQEAMSDLPLKADIGAAFEIVPFGP